VDGWWTGHKGYAAQIMSGLAADPHRIAVEWRMRAIPADEFVVSVTSVVRTLRALDVGPGSTVGVLVAPNSPDMVIARYAAHLLGAAVCYLRSTNPGSTAPVLSAGEQLQILRDTSTGVLYTDVDEAERALELAGRAGIAVTGFDIDADTRVVLKDDPGPGTLPPWDPQALAAVAFTSGSTGRPKGIRLPVRAWDGIVRATMKAPAEADHVKMLVATPLSHTVGPMADAVLAIGGTLVAHEEFDAAEVVRAVHEHGITRMFMATSHLYALVDQVRGAAADLSSLKRVIYSGSAAAPARLGEAVRALGTILVQAYGTTESGRLTSLGPGEHRDPRLVSTVGRPFPEVKIKVCDPETGDEMPAGETGEVHAQSPHLMDGYLTDAALTAQVLRDGWYVTGDLGYLDDQGYLHLVGRVADVVKVAGVKVHPTVVEREILTLDGVAHAAVYGVHDTDNAEHLHAALVRRPEAEISADRVRSHVAAALSPAHVPEEVLLLDAMPLNESGKPDKRRLRSLTDKSHESHERAS
jgi:fatty-acyl-CoA synthase